MEQIPARSSTVKMSNVNLTAAMPNIPRQPSPALTIDQTYSSGQRTPTDLRPTQRRRITLISLIDELSQLRDEEAEKERLHQVIAEDNIGYRDDRVENEGVADFMRFQRRVQDLDKELQNFTNAVRQLGSSVGLLSSAFHLRARLSQILHLFRENAAELFRDVLRQSVEPTRPLSSRKRRKPLRPTQKMRPDITIRNDPEALPEELDFLATDLHTFLECLNQIPEFTDEGVNNTALSFHNDLKYWASGLQEYKDQFRWPSVEHYVNDITKEMEEHLENLTRALTTFVDVGVPTIRFTQQHTADALQNLSTVATFFSAVTATTLQYSYQSFQTRTEEAVNLLWITSLIFSLASAINSQLAYHWRSAIYRSPRSCVPWWVSIWITQTPLLFLVSSVITFSAGLVCFTYATFYNSPFIPIVVTICTSISSFALFAVGLWFAGERYAFAKSKGRKWLAQELEDLIRATKLYTGYQWLASHFPSETLDNYLAWMRGRLKKLFHGLHRASLLFRQNVSSSSLENGCTNSGECGVLTDELPYSNPLSGESSLLPVPTYSNASTRSRVAVAPSVPLIDGVVIDGKNAAWSHPLDGTSHPSSATPGDKFKAVAHRVVRINRDLPLGEILVPGAPSTTSPPGYPIADAQGSSSFGSRHIDSLEAARAKRRPPRLAMLIPALRTFSTTQYLSEHTAPVCHLQFSPNGEFFATCSWDQTAIIWKVGNPFQIHRKLAHAKGFADQVAWSPDGKYLLTKMIHGIKIWVTETGVCQRTISREHDVQSVAWMPSGDGFVTIEGTTVYKMSLNGHLDWKHDFARLSLRNLVVTPDEHRFLAVAILEQTRDGLKPSKSRPEKRVIVFNLKSGEIENQMPVMNEARDITLSVSSNLALVGYEHKTPQLFQINKVHDRARLTLVHTYRPPTPGDFAGTSCLGYFAGTGTEDQIVLGAGKNGEVHLWDRETGRLLHSLRAQDQGSDLTGITWNHGGVGQLMFASAAHDGSVRIWTAPWSGIEYSSVKPGARPATHPQEVDRGPPV